MNIVSKAKCLLVAQSVQVPDGEVKTRSTDFWLWMQYRGPEEDEGNFDVSFSRPFDVTPLSRSKDGFTGKNLQKQTTDLLKKCGVKRLCACHILMETYFFLVRKLGVSSTTDTFISRGFIFY